MSIIVTDRGFRPSEAVNSVTLADLSQHQGSVDLAHTDDPALLEGQLDQITLIRISFPAFSDGRAFTIARRLRMMGYTGELRATGPVIADQYAMARRVGFDSVEIPEELAQRQPEEQWIFRANWKAHDYQSRLRA
ncbi:DUF934 domain-containing protein [Thioclava sp. FR2]|uniref:DUF934 domain-containing protein n=1 Tax=Thioclava sp. FR2 TaxID=3445780 RepID=UPI003EB6DEBB